MTFSATRPEDRDRLGEKVTAWLRQHRGHVVVRADVTLSSDSSHHCLSVTLFWKRP
jgi:hypothetical protein